MTPKEQVLIKNQEEIYLCLKETLIVMNESASLASSKAYQDVYNRIVTLLNELQDA